MSECPFVRDHIACKKLEMCWLRKTDKRTNGHWDYKTANYANYANLLVHRLNRFYTKRMVFICPKCPKMIQKFNFRVH